MRAFRTAVASTLAAALIGVAAVPSGAARPGASRRANRRDATSASRVFPAHMPVPAPAPVLVPHAQAHEGRSDVVPLTTSTPGRVQQLQGQAGYAFDTPSSTTITTTVTVPTIQCSAVPFFDQGNQPGLQESLEIGGQYAMVQSFCGPGGAPGSYQQYNSLNFLLNGVPYRPTGYQGSGPGQQIQLTESATPTSVTATITAEGTNFTKSFTVSASSGSAFIGVLDYPESSTGGEPPYSTVTFGSTTVDGSDLGAYLASGPPPNFAEQNSVWGSDLQDQTSDIGTGSSFTITDANITLPTVTVSSTPTYTEKPSTGTATITFTVGLTAVSTHPVYLDYATADDGAVAGTDYAATSGTLSFPPGATSQTVPVTILAGPRTGNEADFLLDISNPSYAYDPPGSAGVGRIISGPLVTAVSPTTVPLTGGTALTVSGFGFGDPGAADTVQICATSCATAPSRTVEGDTTITLTVPDLTLIHPSGTPFIADVVVTDADSISSPITSDDEVHVGCNQVANQVDGVWVYSGCVIQTDPTDEVTTQASELDGTVVSASSSDTVDYSTGGSNGDAVTSTGSSTVSLNIAGQLTPIFRGILQQPLTGAVTVTPPAATQIEGMALTGPVTLTPGAIGQADGSVTIRLPAWLGSGSGAMTFTTSASGGVSNLRVVVTSASFSDLLALNGVVLGWSAQSGWQLNGTASVGGASADASSVVGSITYVKNKLTAAALVVPGPVSVFGLFDVSALTFNYSAKKGWTGTANVDPHDGPGIWTFSATADATGKITAASIALTTRTPDPVLIEQAIPVQLFSLAYNNGIWSATTQLPAGEKGLIIGTITVAGGVVQSASLTLQKLKFWGWLSLKSAKLSYSLVNGQQVWKGSFDVRLAAQATPIYGIQVAWQAVNGIQIAGGIGLVGNVPIPFIQGLFINQLGGTLQWAPPPAKLIETHVRIGLGPDTPAGQLASIDGSMVRNEPAVPLVGSYTYTGGLTVLNAPLGSAAVDLNDNGVTSISLTLGPGGGMPLTFGPISVGGTLIGTFAPGAITLDGTGSITLFTPKPHTFAATIHADGTGMAACDSSKRGFKWIWGHTPVLQTPGACSTSI